MKKPVKKCLSLLILLFVFASDSRSQAKSGLENYNFLGNGKTYSWMPIMHYEAVNGNYGELRYNYEEQATVSAFLGRRFTYGRKVKCNLTPMIGFSAGKFSGISSALNAELEWKDVFLSAQSQYSLSFGNKDESFIFNWTEMGVTPAKGFFAGVVAQITKTRQQVFFEPGLMAGVEFKRFSIPLYLFNPSHSDRYLMIGVNFEYTIKKKIAK